MSAALAGFVTSMALIAAIGPQNAFVLRQGLLRQHVWTAVAVCFASDVLLIGLGVTGLSAVIAANPSVLAAARIAGGVFILVFAARALWRARRPRGLVAAGEDARSRRGVVGTTLAMTFLNPHVYLDVVLLGSVAAAFGAGGAGWFVAGAIGASLIWFVALGGGARWLSPLLRGPTAWRVIDLVVGVSMAVLGVVLLAS